MQIVHTSEMEWGDNLAAHRHGGMAHKLLFEGEEGSPDNFALVLANESKDYYSPRHRHVFDQVRLCLEGSVPIGRDLAVDAGEVGYFPEGVPYGPQEGGPDRIELLLQFGGAGGGGYLSARQVRRAHEELAREGTFERGVFHRTQGEGRKNEDAYEAVWRHVNQRAIDYPKPRYKGPIVMRPDAFAWAEVAGAPGVKRKMLGTFAERGLTLSFLALAAGVPYTDADPSLMRLIFVREGVGTCNGERYGTGSAIRLEFGEPAELHAKTASDLFVIAFERVAR